MLAEAVDGGIRAHLRLLGVMHGVADGLNVLAATSKGNVVKVLVRMGELVLGHL